MAPMTVVRAAPYRQAPASTLVDSFTGAHAYLSNFHRGQPLLIDGLEYATAEHYFNAAKTLDRGEHEHVRTAPTPAEAKRRGRRVTLRPDWDTRVRYDVMRLALAAKFTDPDLHAQLLATGDALLVEGNHHHDSHWGQCLCTAHRATPGTNHLGRALMALRTHLRRDPAQHWPRAAVTGHRPDAFTPDQVTWVKDELTRLAVKLRDAHGTHVAISGAAQGADTWWAHAATTARLDVWAYVPFTAQAATWEPSAQQRWTELLERSTRTLILGEAYDVRLFHARNDYMIRDANVIIAVHDPAKTTGGTASTMTKAASAGKPTIMVDVPGRRTWLRSP